MQTFYSCFTAKFCAKVAAGRKLAADQRPPGVCEVECSFDKDAIA